MSETKHNISISIDALADATIISAKTGRVIAANGAAKQRFKDSAKLGAFAPWHESSYGWNCNLMEDGSTIGVFRPDADETAKAKTMLFAILSHEIRTPLNGIMGMAELLSFSELTSSQRTWLNAIEDSSQHLMTLLNDILDYAKLESGKIELERVIFNPINTIQSIAEICSPKAHEKNIEIAVAIGKNIPTKVAGDDGRLRQIILNLTTNAVKFTQSGGVIIRLEAPNKNHLLISVEDTGIGVPQNKSEKIFEEFSQADSSHTRRFGGTGLGLAIVKRLANAMSGSVGVKPKNGGGTIFFIDIPFETIEYNEEENIDNYKIAIATKSDVLFDAIKTNIESFNGEVLRINNLEDVKDSSIILLDNGTDEAFEAQLIKSKIPTIALIEQEKRELIEEYNSKGAFGYLIKPLRIASLIERIKIANGHEVKAKEIETANDEREQFKAMYKGLRVLLAEDNRINALLAKEMLKRFGCDVFTVGNGQEAIDAFNTGHYDIIFMDFHMPIMDGLEASRKIRMQSNSNVPIIALTAAAAEEDRRACEAAGMDSFITKPIDISSLKTILDKWIDKKKTFAA